MSLGLALLGIAYLAALLKLAASGAIAPACVVLGRFVLVAVLVVAALAYLAICLGRALEAVSEKQPIGKREVTDAAAAWAGRQGGLQ